MTCGALAGIYVGAAVSASQRQAAESEALNEAGWIPRDCKYCKAPLKRSERECARCGAAVSA